MSKETIKNKFKNGMIPDENDFGDLIDFADNAELLDIRVGFDGTTYDSAGEAVRAIGAFLIEEGQSWEVEE